MAGGSGQHYKRITSASVTRFQAARAYIVKSPERQKEGESNESAFKRSVSAPTMCAVIWLFRDKLLEHREGGCVKAKAVVSQWVDPANQADPIGEWPVRVDPDWPKHCRVVSGGIKGLGRGARVQGCSSRNQDAIFVTRRGELPDLTNAKKKSRRRSDRLRNDGARRGPGARDVRAEASVEA